MAPNLDTDTDTDTDEQTERPPHPRRRRTPFQKLAALAALIGVLTIVLALPIAYAVHGDWTLILCALGVLTLTATAVLASHH